VKTVAVVSVVATIVLAASIIVMYLNFTALIQQQSDLIDQQKEEIQSLKDALMNEFNDYWHNTDLSNIRLNSTAQMSYFQLPN